MLDSDVLSLPTAMMGNTLQNKITRPMTTAVLDLEKNTVS